MSTLAEVEAVVNAKAKEIFAQEAKAKATKATLKAIYKAFNLIQNAQEMILQGIPVNPGGEHADAFRILDEAKKILINNVCATAENSAVFNSILDDPYIWDEEVK